MALFRAIKWLGQLVVAIVMHSRITKVVTAVLVLALAGGLIDYAFNGQKIYSGVKVGDVDLGGKTIEEAESLLDASYSQPMAGLTIDIYASDAAAADPAGSLQTTKDAQTNEQYSLDEVHANTLVWQTSAEALSAGVDTAGLANEAFECGRSDGFIFKRIGAFLFGCTILPRATYSQDAIESLASSIDLCIGNPRVNYGVSMVAGDAVVTEGHDGYMVNRDVLKNELDQAFFDFSGDEPGFVAHTEYVPLQITGESAQQTCDQVNASIAFGALFVFDGATWNANRDDIGQWVDTTVEATGDSWELRPYLDYDRAKGAILTHMKADYDGVDVKVQFSVEDGAPFVNLETAGTIPMSEDAVTSLSDTLFAPGAQITAQPTIDVASAPIPNKLSFQ
ncbi:MAG: hypothetical protein FWD72_05390, partial [Eggerthellaceae bacterium]|nr:hypothetical protein [Eggerthellaceae bacterium]